jgi:hypothetical protein
VASPAALDTQTPPTLNSGTATRPRCRVARRASVVSDKTRRSADSNPGRLLLERHAQAAFLVSRFFSGISRAGPLFFQILRRAMNPSEGVGLYWHER